LINSISSVVISGPTTENNINLKVFNWEDYKDRNIRHEGLPDKYNFKWILASPNNIKNESLNDLYIFNSGK
jgi:hypothetical protein